MSFSKFYAIPENGFDSNRTRDANYFIKSSSTHASATGKHLMLFQKQKMERKERTKYYRTRNDE